MKRRFLIAGLFLGFIIAAIIVVLATRQDTSRSMLSPTIRVTSEGQVIVTPPTAPRMTVVASLQTLSNANHAPRK